MLKGEPTGKKTGLAEQKDLAGNQLELRVQKEESFHLWKTSEATQEYYKDVKRLQRHKIRKAEAN